MNMYIRQSKTNTKNIIIPSLTFANSVEFLEQLTINGYIEKFQKTNEKTNELQMKQKRFIRNRRTKDIAESEMNWNVIITLMLMTNVCNVFVANLILNQLSSTPIMDARDRLQIPNIQQKIYLTGSLLLMHQMKNGSLM